MTDGYLLSENIIHLLGIEALPEEDKFALLDKMSAVLLTRVMLRLDDYITPENEAELNKLGTDPIASFKYLSEKVPQFADILNEETVALKKEMMEAVGQ